MNTRLTALEAGKPEDSFKPAYVDIIGICSFSERDSKGVNRTDAVKLVEELKGKHDATLRVHVREIQLNSGKNHFIRVPISTEHIREVANTWKDFNQTPGNGCIDRFSDSRRVRPRCILIFTRSGRSSGRCRTGQSLGHLILFWIQRFIGSRIARS